MVSTTGGDALPASGAAASPSPLRNEIGTFAEALVSTRMEVQNLRAACEKLDAEFQELKGRHPPSAGKLTQSNPELDAQVKELTNACAAMKAWRESYDTERHQLNHALRQEMGSLISEQVEKVNQGLRSVEFQLPQLWKALSNGAAVPGAVQRPPDEDLEDERSERIAGIQRLEAHMSSSFQQMEVQLSTFDTKLKELAVSQAANHFSINEEIQRLDELQEEMSTIMYEKAASYTTWMQINDQKVEEHLASRIGRESDFQAMQQAYDAMHIRVNEIERAGGPSSGEDLQQLKQVHDETKKTMHEKAEAHETWMQSINESLEADRADRMARESDVKAMQQAYDSLNVRINEIERAAAAPSIKESPKAATFSPTMDVDHMLEKISELRESFKECNQQTASAMEEVKTMKVTWATAHSCLTEDMRELMNRFNSATPLQLGEQMSELRKSLTAETQQRSNDITALSARLLHIDWRLKELPSDANGHEKKPPVAVVATLTEPPPEQTEKADIESVSSAPTKVAAASDKDAVAGSLSAPSSRDAFVVIEGAGSERVNGMYVKTKLMNDERPIYHHETERQMRIQWSTQADTWTLSEFSGLALYKLAKGRRDKSFPCDAAWEIYQGGKMPLPRSFTMQESLARHRAAGQRPPQTEHTLPLRTAQLTPPPPLASTLASALRARSSGARSPSPVSLPADHSARPASPAGQRPQHTARSYNVPTDSVRGPLTPTPHARSMKVPVGTMGPSGPMLGMSHSAKSLPGAMMSFAGSVAPPSTSSMRVRSPARMSSVGASSMQSPITWVQRQASQPGQFFVNPRF